MVQTVWADHGYCAVCDKNVVVWAFLIRDRAQRHRSTMTDGQSREEANVSLQTMLVSICLMTRQTGKLLTGLFEQNTNLCVKWLQLTNRLKSRGHSITGRWCTDKPFLGCQCCQLAQTDHGTLADKNTSSCPAHQHLALGGDRGGHTRREGRPVSRSNVLKRHVASEPVA